MKIYYNPKLKQRARELRNSSTLSEVLLWNELKARKMKGYQFMRQKPIGDYIVDFFCAKLRLIIEVDGESHNEKGESDRMRQKDLEAQGLSFLRFDDLAVKQNLEGVVQAVANWIEEFERRGCPPKKQPPGPPSAPLRAGSFLRGNCPTTSRENKWFRFPFKA